MDSFSIVKLNDDTRDYLQDLISCKLNQDINYIFNQENNLSNIEGFTVSLNQWRNRRRLPISLLECFVNSSSIFVKLEERLRHTFFHTIPTYNLNSLYKNNKLLLKIHDDPYETLLGDAVYAHLANGGIYWGDSRQDTRGVIFTTSQPAVIVADTATELNDCGIGEVLFTKDVILDSYRVIPNEEIRDFIRFNFSWEFINYYLDREYRVSDCDELQYHRYNINNEPLIPYTRYNTNPTLEVTLKEFIFYMEIISSIKNWTHLYYQRTGILDKPVVLKRYYDWIKIHKLDVCENDLLILEEL